LAFFEKPFFKKALEPIAGLGARVPQTAKASFLTCLLALKVISCALQSSLTSAGFFQASYSPDA